MNPSDPLHGVFESISDVSLYAYKIAMGDYANLVETKTSQDDMMEFFKSKLERLEKGRGYQEENDQFFDDDVNMEEAVCSPKGKEKDKPAVCSPKGKEKDKPEAVCSPKGKEKDKHDENINENNFNVDSDGDSSIYESDGGTTNNFNKFGGFFDDDSDSISGEEDGFGFGKRIKKKVLSNTDLPLKAKQELKKTSTIPDPTGGIKKARKVQNDALKNYSKKRKKLTDIKAPAVPRRNSFPSSPNCKFTKPQMQKIFTRNCQLGMLEGLAGNYRICRIIKKANGDPPDFELVNLYTEEKVIKAWNYVFKDIYLVTEYVKAAQAKANSAGKNFSTSSAAAAASPSVVKTTTASSALKIAPNDGRKKVQVINSNDVSDSDDDSDELQVIEKNTSKYFKSPPLSAEVKEKVRTIVQSNPRNRPKVVISDADQAIASTSLFVIIKEFEYRVEKGAWENPAPLGLFVGASFSLILSHLQNRGSIFSMDGKDYIGFSDPKEIYSSTPWIKGLQYSNKPHWIKNINTSWEQYWTTILVEPFGESSRKGFWKIMELTHRNPRN